jgi:hypothetical protein
MPSVTNKGGHISENANPDNYAGVDQATATQTGPAAASWVVTLTNVQLQRYEEYERRQQSDRDLGEWADEIHLQRQLAHEHLVPLQC